MNVKIARINELRNSIYDQIGRELLTGVCKGGEPSKLSAEQRQALENEYQNADKRIIGKDGQIKSDAELEAIIMAMEAFQQKAIAALNPTGSPVQTPEFVELIGAMEVAGFKISAYIREPGDADLRAAQLVSELNDKLSGYDVAMINTHGAQINYLTPTHPILRQFFVEATPSQWHTLTPLGKFVYDHMPSMT